MVTLLFALLFNGAVHADALAEVRLEVQRCMDDTSDSERAQISCFREGSRRLTPMVRRRLGSAEDFESWVSDAGDRCGFKAEGADSRVQRTLLEWRCYYQAMVRELN